MVQESIKIALRNFGLTDKEIEVFLILSKRGAQKTSQISKQLKTNRGLTYRLLKTLQKKGVIEATLESPTRYTATSFEKIIDSYVKSKQEEAKRIEETKKSLLLDWEKISQKELEDSLERFAVIEGGKKIYRRISKMLEEPSNQIMMVLTVSDLCSAERLCVFDSFYRNQEKEKINFRILTHITSKSLNAVKQLKTKLKPEIDFRGMSPTLGKPSFSRMVIRDYKELILFISYDFHDSSKQVEEVCLSTNCKSIIDAFSGVFDNLWKDSVEIDDVLNVIETGKLPDTTQIIKDSLDAVNRYHQILYSAKEEVILVTSESGLVELKRGKTQLKKLSEQGVSIKILAPITIENLFSAKELLEFCEVKHIPLGYFETAIIDNQHLFQFDYELEKTDEPRITSLKNTYYTTNLEHIRKTKRLLSDIWSATRIPSLTNIRQLVGQKNIQNCNFEKHHQILEKRIIHQNLKHRKIGELSELEVREKIKEEKRLVEQNKSCSNGSLRYFGTRAFALIEFPKSFNIPKLIIGVFKDDIESDTHGQNYMVIDACLGNESEEPYVPVAFVQDNPELLEYRKKNLKMFAGRKNIFKLIDKKHFQVHFNGNTLFAGWTVPITLHESKFVLPPACILFEGYGKIKPGYFTNTTPFGRVFEIWYNSLDAFVTFYHPKSKYIGTGTEAYIDTESYWNSKPS